MDDTQFKWQRRTAFAEYAEALCIDTIDVLAVTPTRDGANVLYSTNTHDLHSARLWAVVLTRDAGGVLVPSPHRKEILGGLDKLRELMGEA